MKALAEWLQVLPQKIYYWIRQDWIRSRRTPGKHWIVWADADELKRLKTLSRQQNSWTAHRNPNLTKPPSDAK